MESQYQWNAALPNTIGESSTAYCWCCQAREQLRSCNFPKMNVPAVLHNRYLFEALYPLMNSLLPTIYWAFLQSLQMTVFGFVCFLFLVNIMESLVLVVGWFICCVLVAGSETSQSRFWGWNKPGIRLSKLHLCKSYHHLQSYVPNVSQVIMWCLALTTCCNFCTNKNPHQSFSPAGVSFLGRWHSLSTKMIKCTAFLNLLKLLIRYAAQMVSSKLNMRLSR